MRAVNLLPEDSKSTRFAKPGVYPVAGAAAAVVAVGLVVGLAHVESGKVAAKEKRVNYLQQQLSLVQLPSAPTASTSGTALLTSRDARIAALDSALTGRIPWEVALRQLAAVLPEDTWLDGVTMNAPAAPTPAAPTAPASGDSSSGGDSSTTDTPPPATATPTTAGVTITGYTSSPDSLARVLQRLSVLPSLTDVKLTTSQRAPVGSKNVFQFTISANVATSGGAS
jgi:Tfp pilus assembly protein PilN